MGAGDGQLAEPVELVLAWQSWTPVMDCTVITFAYANVATLVMAAYGRALRRTSVPFSPAMLGGVFIFVLVSWTT